MAWFFGFGFFPLYYIGFCDLCLFMLHTKKRLKLNLVSKYWRNSNPYSQICLMPTSEMCETTNCQRKFISVFSAFRLSRNDVQYALANVFLFSHIIPCFPLLLFLALLHPRFIFDSDYFITKSLCINCSNTVLEHVFVWTEKPRSQHSPG